MPEFGDFDPILPDPQPLIEKALLLYERAAKSKRGRIVFLTAELGGGKTEQLGALAGALHLVSPRPNLIAGYFQDGEYRRYILDWQHGISLKKAVGAAGSLSSLLGLLPISYAFAFNLIGQLLETLVGSHDFAEEFQRKASHRGKGPDRLKQVMRSASEDVPLVVLLDNWDEAERFAWDSMLISLAKEVVRDLPILMFITVRGPISLKTTQEDGSNLSTVISNLTERGLAEVWPVRKLTAAEVAAAIGEAVPGIAGKLHGVTAGNARWVRELWREWRLNEVVVLDRSDRWIWGTHHTGRINLYDDILRDRLHRVLVGEGVVEVEEIRDALACGALEGIHFTADAVARSMGWDREELINLFDDVLLQTDENPDGLLREEGGVTIKKPGGETHTLWRYSFISDLHWMALERYGFADERRPGREGSERLEKSAAMADALTNLYSPEERMVASSVARLLRATNQEESARHFQRMADYMAGRAQMRELAFYILALDKNNWEIWELSRNARFLYEAGWAMLNAYPYSETMMVMEEAYKLGVQAKDKHTAAWARYACGSILHAESNYQTARKWAIASLSSFKDIRDKYGEAVSLYLLAEIDHSEGSYTAAREGALRSLRIHEELGNRRGEAASLRLLAEIDYSEGNYAAAMENALRSLDMNQGMGDRRRVAVLLKLLAEIYHSEGDYAAARESALRSLEIDKELGDRRGEAILLNLLAEIDYSEGNYAAAREGALRSLDVNQGIGDRHGEASSLYVLAKLDCYEGNYAAAREGGSHSLEICKAIGDPRGEAASLNLLADIDHFEGNYAAAKEGALRSLEIYKELGDRNGESALLIRLADIDHSEGNYATAREGGSRSLEICKEIGEPDGEAASLRLLADIDHSEGNYAAAREGALRSLEIYKELGDPSGKALSFRLLGRIAFSSGKLTEARDLLALSLAILTQIGHRDAIKVSDDLEALLSKVDYSEEEKRMLFQRVKESIHADGGSGLFGKALAALREDEN